MEAEVAASEPSSSSRLCNACIRELANSSFEREEEAKGTV